MYYDRVTPYQVSFGAGVFESMTFITNDNVKVYFAECFYGSNKHLIADDHYRIQGRQGEILRIGEYI